MKLPARTKSRVLKIKGRGISAKESDGWKLSGPLRTRRERPKRHCSRYGIDEIASSHNRPASAPCQKYS
jgi:hypothetical protein